MKRQPLFLLYERKESPSGRPIVNPARQCGALSDTRRNPQVRQDDPIINPARKCGALGDARRKHFVRAISL